MTINKLKSINWFLVAVIALATVLRLWKLGSIPPHLTPDEASLGYNAYSILKTGKDEYGEFLPMIFKSFGDYKPGLYVYLTVPLVAIFGLTEFAVRLPSALGGVLSIYLIYLIVKKLFNSLEIGDWRLEILAAIIAASNPWLIYFSRGAWEVNVSLTLTLLGIYFFLKAFENSKLLVISSSFFALTLLAYQGAKLSTAIVVLILLLLYWKRIFKMDKKVIFVSLALALFLVLPVILSIFQGKAGRLEVFSVFSYPRPGDYLQSQLAQGNEKVGSISYYLFHSEALNFTRGILGRYFNHFSGRFLFFEGDWSNPRHSAPYQGMLLLSDIVLLLLGLVSLLKLGFKKETTFTWLWLLLSPLPAVLSRDQVHAVRAFNMTIPLIIILAFGLATTVKWISEQKISTPYYLLLATFYFVGLVYFLDAYFVHVPKHSSYLWEYGYKQIVETVTPIQGNYKKILVQQSFAQPYIYFLFFQKYDPARYQKMANLVSSGTTPDVGYVTKLDNIEFGPIDWSVNRGDHGILIVGDPVRIPPEDSKDESQFKLIDEIKYLNGRDTAFRILEVK